MIAATTDPEGRRIILDEAGWSHIKRRHWELTRNLREIMAAVREPDIQSFGRAADELWFLAESDERLPWLHVVVHYEGGEGWIVTAFRRSSPPRR